MRKIICHRTKGVMLNKCGSAPDKGVAVAGRERVEEHVQGKEHALQA